MDLIRAYSPFNSNLRDLETLRTKKHREFTGSYYFGEYLSQSSLKIEGNCQIISAHAIIEKGLFLLLPDLQRSLDTEDKLWANAVISLREVFYQCEADPQQMTGEAIQAVMNIAHLFEPRWRLPMAASFAALRPHPKDNLDILRAFRLARFTSSTLFYVFGYAY